PDGILFIGDPKSATLYAIDTKAYRSKSPSSTATSDYQIADVRANIAAATASEADQIEIADMAIDHESATLFMSVTIGEKAQLISFTPGSDAQPVNLDKVMASSVKLTNPPEDAV